MESILAWMISRTRLVSVSASRMPLLSRQHPEGGNSMRLAEAALEKGINVNVFAYEGQ